MIAEAPGASVLEELQRIADVNSGVLRAEDVVESARNEGSPLHSTFEWDDSVAGQQYRLWQARKLISVTVRFINTGKENIPVRAFVSLTPDREVPGGGYRSVVAVLARKDMREQMLADALHELKRLEEKYASLTELADVFAAARKLRKVA